ncbi:MAG: hypothetical protein LBV44_06940 [Methylobacillus sp.]|jgi:hypothetical protein|nr:hypothetical protein [Methylobacillus sp.]
MKISPLLACLVVLVFARPALADSGNSRSNFMGSAPPDEQAEEHRQLDESMRPESRQRLREVVNAYSRQAYPDGEQVEERRRMMQERLSSVGSITRSEAQLRMPRLAKKFDRVDLNGDGVITSEELQIARERGVLMEKRDADGAVHAEVSAPEPRATKTR